MSMKTTSHRHLAQACKILLQIQQCRNRLVDFAFGRG